MKLKINTLVRKFDGPARAIIDVNVTELQPDEKFEQKRVDTIALSIYEEHFAFLLENADFFGHQTFITEIHFKYKEQELVSHLYPCYTTNF